MVNKTAIARNLRELDIRYNRRSRNPRDPLYYSKLSLIELCGWIEITMDDIIRSCARKHIKRANNLKYVEDSIINKTHSFTYKSHFREMLIAIVSLVKVEELEGKLDRQKFDTMRSSLGSLKKQRDSEAHTYTDNATQTVYAPSLIAHHFENVYYGLKDIEKCVRRLSL